MAPALEAALERKVSVANGGKYDLLYKLNRYILMHLLCSYNYNLLHAHLNTSGLVSIKQSGKSTSDNKIPNNFCCHDYTDLSEGTVKITASRTKTRNYVTEPHTQISRVITRCLHSLVMVWIDTHFVLFEVEGILAGINGPQLMVAVKVRPSPKAAVDDVGQALTMGHLETPIQ